MCGWDGVRAGLVCGLGGIGSVCDVCVWRGGLDCGMCVWAELCVGCGGCVGCVGRGAWGGEVV